MLVSGTNIMCIMKGVCCVADVLPHSTADRRWDEWVTVKRLDLSPREVGTAPTEMEEEEEVCCHASSFTCAQATDETQIKNIEVCQIR